jgi:hypothetical protein
VGDHGNARGEIAEGAHRRVLYCVVPEDLAEKLHRPLREHFGDDPGVEVVVENRRANRREVEDRRSGAGQPPKAGERRRIRSRSGRRVEERRATQVPLDPADAPELERAASRRA